MPASATGLGHYKARQVRHGLAVVKVRCCQGQLGRKGPPHPLQFRYASFPRCTMAGALTYLHLLDSGQ